MTHRESSIAVNGMAYRLQSWGEEQALPMLAIHGWLDNSESFAPLGHHLEGVHLVAPDLAGHGKSDHRPPSGSYNIWDDLRDLVLIADALGWQQFSVMGHSRGAMIAMLLAAAMPDRVSHAIFLDGFWPFPEPAEKAPEQLRRHIVEFNRSRNPVPSYASIDDAIASRQAYTRLPADVLRPMVERNLRADAGRYSWSTDARLRYASAFKLTEAHSHAFAEAIRCPGLALLASKGMAKYREMIEVIGSRPNLHVQVQPGDHHWHMQTPALVAGAIRGFLANPSAVAD